MTQDDFPNQDEASMIRQLGCALADEMEPAQVAELIGTFGYFRAKAQIYLRKGPEAYRRDDFFHVPREEWTVHELSGIERGFREVLLWKGLTAATALDSVDLCDLYRIMEVVHFRLEDLAMEVRPDGNRVHCAHMRHRVDNRELRLFFETSEGPTCATGSASAANETVDESSMPAGTRFGVRRQLQPRVEHFPELYGYSPEHPILCWDPFGERMFVAALRCPNGHRFSAHRIGSLSGLCPDLSSHQWPFETGDADRRSCPVDKYRLECHGGEHSCHLYFDMYHPGFLLQPAPRGLHLTPVDLEPR